MIKDLDIKISNGNLKSTYTKDGIKYQVST